MNFYGSNLGNRLIDKSFFPMEIKEFLIKEENLLTQMKPSFNFLVEVGCMHGRYLQWAHKNNLNYIGIDIVSSYIEKGTKRLKNFSNELLRREFILCNAEHVDTLLKISKINPNKTLLLFPFNSFGNMQDFLSVIKSIKRSKAKFFISTYSTEHVATLCRQKYYEACSYLELKKIENQYGVMFISKDGLRTVAYHLNFLLKTFKEEDINVDVINFTKIGIAYTSLGLLKG